MKMTKAGITIIEDDDPIPQDGWKFTDQLFSMINIQRKQINKIAEVIDKLMERIEDLEMRGNTNE